MTPAKPQAAAEPGPTPARQAGDDATDSPDVVLIHGVTPDGAGLAVLRHRNHRLEVGTVRALREGQPIHGEVVRLTPRAHAPLVCDVEVSLPRAIASVGEDVGTTTADAARHGPAQVASDRYRANWDAIWQRPAKEDPLN